jgi:hypothetical protein
MKVGNQSKPSPRNPGGLIARPLHLPRHNRQSMGRDLRRPDTHTPRRHSPPSPLHLREITLPTGRPVEGALSRAPHRAGALAHGLADILAYQAGSGARGRRTGDGAKPRVSQNAGTTTSCFRAATSRRRRVPVEHAFHPLRTAFGQAARANVRVRPGDSYWTTDIFDGRPKMLTVHIQSGGNPTSVRRFQ